MRHPKNPMGPYPPGKHCRPPKSRERERIEAELIREARKTRR